MAPSSPHCSRSDLQLSGECTPQCVAKNREKEKKQFKYRAVKEDFYRLKSAIMLQDLVTMLKVVERLGCRIPEWRC
jgi:hypothetical protein